MQAVILAGGASSRFWPLNQKHKALTHICGRTLIEYTVAGLVERDVTDIVIVQGPDRDIEAELSLPPAVDITFVVQDAPDGMGDALEQAREHVNETFIVTGPYRYDIGSLLEHMLPLDGAYEAAVVGAETAQPGRYGMLALDAAQETATGVVEKPAPGEEPSSYKIVSTYVLEPGFFDQLDAVDTHQYHFEDALDTYMGERSVRFVELATEPPSLKYPWDLCGIARDLLEQQEPHIADSADVADSATIDGNVVIGDNVQVYENAVIRGPCYIGEDATVGNNAVIRNHTVIEAGATIGANAEIRGSIIQEGFSCHSGFIGDSLIGRNVAIGAGTVTANRLARTDTNERPEIAVYIPSKDERVQTGRDRLGAIIGDDADIGTQANLMPGKCVGAGAFVWPSALVTRNVENGATYRVHGRDE